RHVLAALEHVDHWAERFEVETSDLAAIADQVGWRAEPARSLGLARSCYGHLPDGTPLWLAVDRVVTQPIDPIRQRLAAVS
ncbi:MAG: hypothetical protein ACHQDC_04820, partial [Acidimicrobiales bacterium]